jgi:pyruvate, water dikinase
VSRVANELGIPAATGFAVTTAAFDHFLRENHLIESIDAMLGRFDPNQDDAMEACQRIRDRIQEAPVPTTIMDAIDRAYDGLARQDGGERAFWQ